MNFGIQVGPCEVVGGQVCRHVEGGYEAVRERVSSIKAAATEHFEAGRVDIALSGYLMGIHMCVGGNYPNTICPATSPTPAGRVLLLALRFLGTHGSVF